MNKDFNDFRLSEVPHNQQDWVRRALVDPLNRLLVVLRRPTMNAERNLQTFSKTVVWSESTTPTMEATSTLQGRCQEIRVARARALDSSGHPGAALSGVTCGWNEVVSGGVATLKVTSVSGLVASTSYLLDFVAEGA